MLNWLRVTGRPQISADLIAKIAENSVKKEQDKAMKPKLNTDRICPIRNSRGNISMPVSRSL